MCVLARREPRVYCSALAIRQKEARMKKLRQGRVFAVVLVTALGASAAYAASPSDINPPPTAKDWADIAKLPDWSGVWNVNETWQNQEITRNPTPWTPKAAKQIAAMLAEEKAGHPRGLYVDCLPEGMPTWMMIYHNAFEFLFTPGRVTILGETDGDRKSTRLNSSH